MAAVSSTLAFNSNAHTKTEAKAKSAIFPTLFTFFANQKFIFTQ